MEGNATARRDNRIAHATRHAVTQHHSELPSDYIPIVQAIIDYQKRDTFLKKRRWRPKYDFVIYEELMTPIRELGKRQLYDDDVHF